MKRLLKLLVTIVMLLTLVCSGFACGASDDTGNRIDADIDLAGKDADNDANTIECYVYSAGYGVEWLNVTAKEFMRRYPEYKIVAQEMSSNTTLRNKLSTGPKFTADLIITGGDINSLLEASSSIYSGYPIIFDNIDDVYDSVPLSDSGNVKMSEKMEQSSAEKYYRRVTVNNKKESHYYAAPWTVGYNGLFYNVDLFNRAGLTSEPRTTDELLSYCETLKAHNITPIIMSSADDYIQYLSWVWWAQYEGQEGIENFYYLRESEDAYPSANGAVFNQKGYREMFKVYEKLLKGDNVNAFCESFGYTDAQRNFLKGDTNKVEHGAMMPNGNWLENEMTSSSTTETVANISVMQTPIMSALVDKLSFWNETGSYGDVALSADKKAEYDAKLCEIIDYVDGKIQVKPTGVSDEDIQIVEKARAYYYGGSSSSLAIPTFATAKEGAKKFISFLASDVAINLYFRATTGNVLPYEYDFKNDPYYSEMSDLAKKIIDKRVGKFEVADENNYITFYKGGFAYDQGLKNKNFAITFGSKDSASRYTAEQVLNNVKSYYNNANLTALLKNCGLIV